jgi:starch phosphorylase
MLRPSRTFTVVPSLPPRLSPLTELAFNLWWSWQADVAELFRRLDGDLWTSTHHNPVLMLGRITQDRLDEVVEDEALSPR